MVNPSPSHILFLLFLIGIQVEVLARPGTFKECLEQCDLKVKKGVDGIPYVMTPPCTECEKWDCMKKCHCSEETDRLASIMKNVCPSREVVGSFSKCMNDHNYVLDSCKFDPESRLFDNGTMDEEFCSQLDSLINCRINVFKPKCGPFNQYHLDRLASAINFYATLQLLEKIDDLGKEGVVIPEKCATLLAANRPTDHSNVDSFALKTQLCALPLAVFPLVISIFLWKDDRI